MSQTGAPQKDAPPTTHEHDSLLTRVYEGESPDSTESDVRYAAYANRVRTLLRAGHRYVAYTSDIGESFRPLAHPNLVRAAYGVSWLYLTGDVLNEGYKAYLANQTFLHGGRAIGPVPEFLRDAPAPAPPRSAAAGGAAAVPRRGAQQPLVALDDELDLPDDGVRLRPQGKVPWLEDYRTVMAQRALFQSIASMGLPAFTIHSVVKYSGKALKDNKNRLLRTWGPIGLGLAIVPALPFMFDHPVEVAVETAFAKGYEAFTCEKAEHPHKKEPAKEL